MKTLFTILLAILLFGCCNNSKSYESYIEWCNEKVEVEQIVYDVLLRYHQEPDTIIDGIESYLGSWTYDHTYSERRVDEDYLNTLLKRVSTRVVSIESHKHITKKPRCTPTESHYLEWKECGRELSEILLEN